MGIGRCMRRRNLTDGSVSVVSPGAYCVSDEVGDFDGLSGLGLFYRDVRHLSGLRLRINGVLPLPLASWTRGSEAEFALSAGVGVGGIGVLRRRTLGGGMEEEILFSNEADVAVEVRAELECEADFRDVFEVRGYHRATERGEISEEVGDGTLRFSYRRGGFWRGTVVRVSGEVPLAEPGRLSFEVHLGPGEERAVSVSVVLEEGGEEVRLRRSAVLYGEAPVLQTDWAALRESWERSVEDLEMLSFDAGKGLLVPAAGAPWYMALFRRDALITGYTRP